MPTNTNFLWKLSDPTTCSCKETPFIHMGFPQIRSFQIYLNGFPFLVFIINPPQAFHIFRKVSNRFDLCMFMEVKTVRNVQKGNASGKWYLLKINKLIYEKDLKNCEEGRNRTGILARFWHILVRLILRHLELYYKVINYKLWQKKRAQTTEYQIYIYKSKYLWFEVFFLE